eukprot:1029421-Prymnesium_polylepis.2
MDRALTLVPFSLVSSLRCRPDCGHGSCRACDIRVCPSPDALNVADADENVRFSVVETLGKLEPAVLATHAAVLVAKRSRTPDRDTHTGGALVGGGVWRRSGQAGACSPGAARRHACRQARGPRSGCALVGGGDAGQAGACSPVLGVGRRTSPCLCDKSEDKAVICLAKLGVSTLAPHSRDVLSNLKDPSMYDPGAMRSAVIHIKSWQQEMPRWEPLQ